MKTQSITIDLVSGGYVVTYPVSEADSKTEVFTSTAKMLRAVRQAVDEFTLVPKKTVDKDED